jgi:hypothetical protein
MAAAACEQPNSHGKEANQEQRTSLHLSPLTLSRAISSQTEGPDLVAHGEPPAFRFATIIVRLTAGDGARRLTRGQHARIGRRRLLVAVPAERDTRSERPRRGSGRCDSIAARRLLAISDGSGRQVKSWAFHAT